MFTLHNILEPPLFESHLENREVIALFVSFRAFIAPESPMSIDGCGVFILLVHVDSACIAFPCRPVEKPVPAPPLFR